MKRAYKFLLVAITALLLNACSTHKQATSGSASFGTPDTSSSTTAGAYRFHQRPYYYPGLTYRPVTFTPPKLTYITYQDCYNMAYNELQAMLDGRKPLDFERAVFLVENAYYKNRVRYEDFQKVIERHVKRIELIIAANDKSATMDFRTLTNARRINQDFDAFRYTEQEKKELYRKALTNWAITTYLTDTTFFGGKEHLPFSYQLSDPFGMADWRNSQVMHLLTSQGKKGNCFAMVALFKIFSNRLNSEAYICTAPQHIYIQHKDQKGHFYNLELSTGTYPGDGTLQTLTFTYREAILSGISLRRLQEEKQNIALCLVNLGKGYERQFESRSDNFLMKCAELSLLNDSLSLNALLLKQQVLEEEVIQYVIANNIEKIGQLEADPAIAKTFQALEAHTKYLYDLGYRQMPRYMQDMVLSALQKKGTGEKVAVQDRTPNPFTSINVPAKSKRYSTLSGGLYEEVHKQRQLEEIGRLTFDTRLRTIVGIEVTNKFEFPIDPVVFAWSVDPMAHERVSWTPYNAFRNNPILNIDPTGALDTKYVDEDGNEIQNTNDGIDRTVTVKDEQRAGFDASMQMAARNNWTDNSTFNTILSDRIDQTNFNSTAGIRSNIGAVADSHIGETTWNKDVAKGNFPAGSWKCNKFVFDAINESGVTAPTTPGGWPLNAGAWGDKNTFIPGWTVLSNNFQPGAGDVAAESHNYTDATGHTGIVSQFGQTTSATDASVVRNDWGFRPENTGNTVFRRYIGR